MDFDIPNAMSFDLDKMYCGAISRGDVVICEADGKEKVMVVLQDNILNDELSTVVCAPIESVKKGEETLINEVMLKSSEAGLDSDGICMPHKVVTISKKICIEKKSNIGKEKVNEIFRALDITLGRFRDGS